MHHVPKKAAEIIATCACLHNLAIHHRMPAPIPELDDDADGIRHGEPQLLDQPPPHQALAAVRRQVVLRRQQYIDNNF